MWMMEGQEALTNYVMFILEEFLKCWANPGQGINRSHCLQPPSVSCLVFKELRDRKMKSVLVLLSCVFCVCWCLDTEQGVSELSDSPRQPRLFFVSTSSTTSTISTLTYCFSSSAAAVTACRRKKRRSLVADSVEALGEGELIEPARSSPLQLEQGEQEAGAQRQGRFFLYWITTTSTSTTTTFTATSTIQSVVCTPQGFYSECG